ACPRDGREAGRRPARTGGPRHRGLRLRRRRAEAPAPRVSWTTRLRKDAALHGLPPARTGRPGRPRVKGDRLPSLAKIAAAAEFSQVTVTRYGRTETVAAAV